MNKHTTLLLTSPPAGLLADIARKRPGWEIVPLDDAVPTGPLEGRVWAFIDWLCPTMSGLEMCRRLRETEAARTAHLTLVLDEPSVEARRRALQAGADDYLVGPLDVARLLDRVDNAADDAAPLRRQLENGTIALDPAAHQVRVAGKPVPMRPNEFRLLRHFMEHPDQVFSRTALIDRLGKDLGAIDDRTVDVWVGRLRRALIGAGAPDPLRTVRSLGYVMDSVEG